MPHRSESARLLSGESITKVVDARNGGTSIDAELGEAILVCLAETPTSGYRWAVDHLDEEVLAAEGSKFGLPAGAAMGGAGDRTFIFKAVGRGTGRIGFMLGRQWEGPASAVDQVEVLVRVGEPG